MKNCKVKQIWNEMLKTWEMLYFLFILMQALKIKLVQVETYVVFLAYDVESFYLIILHVLVEKHLIEIE